MAWPEQAADAALLLDIVRGLVAEVRSAAAGTQAAGSGFSEAPVQGPEPASYDKTILDGDLTPRHTPEH